MTAQNSSEYLQEFATLIKDVLEKIFQRIGRLTFSQEATIERKDILEYERKMRISALEKFNTAGYVAAINYYKTQRDKDINKACGAMVVYLVEQGIGKLLEATGIPKFDEDDSELVIDKCCVFCQNVSNGFVRDLATKGYKDVIPSDPFGNRNTIPQGVDFSYDQYDKYDISFTVKDTKVIVIEITMANLLKG